jgi:hypothetical protein
MEVKAHKDPCFTLIGYRVRGAPCAFLLRHASGFHKLNEPMANRFGA